MKKLLALLFSLFLLSSLSVFADDISNFEIERMSVGDSLLDFMNEGQILEGIEITKERYNHLKEPSKFAQILLTKELLTYDGVSIYIKNNSTNQYITDRNEKYIIYALSGMIRYNEDFDGCIQKRDEIEEVLSKMFQDADKSELTGDYSSDPSGDSFAEVIEFLFPSGAEIELQCIDMEESFRIKKNWAEGLFVAIHSEEVIKWFQNTK